MVLNKNNLDLIEEKTNINEKLLLNEHSAKEYENLQQLHANHLLEIEKRLNNKDEVLERYRITLEEKENLVNNQYAQLLEKNNQ